MARAVVEVVITKTGFFFTGNPSGAVHMSIYDALEEMAQVGASAAANVLTVGHGVLPYAHNVSWGSKGPWEMPAGALQASIKPVLVKAGRVPVFKGRAYVIQGADPLAPVRFYGGKINKQYRHMYRGAAASAAYATSQASTWAGNLQAWLSKS